MPQYILKKAPHASVDERDGFPRAIETLGTQIEWVSPNILASI